MISQAKDKKKLKFGAVWIWCIGEGYEQKETEENFLDATFSKNGEITGFIFEFDKTVNEMLSCIEKAQLPIYVTLSGIIILSSFVQLKNALSYMVVTLFPIVTFLSPKQEPKAS